MDEFGHMYDGEAWWAAIYGVAQSQTRLKWLSSSIVFFFPKDVEICSQQCFLFFQTGECYQLALSSVSHRKKSKWTQRKKKSTWRLLLYHIVYKKQLKPSWLMSDFRVLDSMASSCNLSYKLYCIQLWVDFLTWAT